MISLHQWGEKYLYAPDPVQRLLSLILLPLSWLYCLIVYFRYRLKRPFRYGIPVVSVGNLTVGGSGKTPLVTALAGGYERPGILLRGYGRQSRGLFVVSDGQRIQCDVATSGDEAMIYAQKLPKAVVIVSECRECAIELFEQMGCEVLFLVDGYSKHHIQKLELLIDVKTLNTACLPSGPFRERLWAGKEAIVLSEEKDFTRRTKLIDGTARMALVTAIARPERLDRFLPEVCGKYYFKEHHFFTKDELESVLQTSGASSLLVTYKDYVKMAEFGLPLSLLDLELELDPSLVERVRQYVKGEI